MYSPASSLRAIISIRKDGMKPVSARECLMISHRSLMSSTGRSRKPGSRVASPKAEIVIDNTTEIAWKGDAIIK